MSYSKLILSSNSGGKPRELMTVVTALGTSAAFCSLAGNCHSDTMFNKQLPFRPLLSSYRISWLGFVNLTQLEFRRKRNHNWGSDSVRFPICMYIRHLWINDWCVSIQHLWTGGPGKYKKAGWLGHGEQVSKQHFSMVSSSVLACCFLPWIQPWLLSVMNHDGEV